MSSNTDPTKRRESDRLWHQKARRGVYGLREYVRRRDRDLRAARDRIREELDKLGE